MLVHVRIRRAMNADLELLGLKPCSTDVRPQLVRHRIVAKLRIKPHAAAIAQQIRLPFSLDERAAKSALVAFTRRPQRQHHVGLRDVDHRRDRMPLALSFVAEFAVEAADLALVDPHVGMHEQALARADVMLHARALGDHDSRVTIPIDDGGERAKARP